MITSTDTTLRREGRTEGRKEDGYDAKMIYKLDMYPTMIICMCIPPKEGNEESSSLTDRLPFRSHV